MSDRKAPKTYLSEARQIASSDFITRNNLQLRPAAEILEQYQKSAAANSFFNFETDVYLAFLPLDLAKALLKPEYIEKVERGEEEFEWVGSTEEAAQDFLDYMNFAWGKAQDERGLSASRSVQKLGAWLWALGRKDLQGLINDNALYAPYGAPALIAVCEKMGIAIPASLRDFADQ